MKRAPGDCLICHKPLIYFERAKPLTCAVCHRDFDSHASCEEGHYICDDCHAAKGTAIILEACRTSQAKNPVLLLQALMERPELYMHGPEHHVLVGAVLLTTYHNSGGRLELAEALEEMKARGGAYPGGACGLWGCCGAAVSAGMFVSIATGASPLSGRSWGLSNDMTARALAAIAALGGPRCCKRNSFTAVREAAAFSAEHLGVTLELPADIRCLFSPENHECLRRRCPYYPGEGGR